VYHFDLEVGTNISEKHAAYKAVGGGGMFLQNTCTHILMAPLPEDQHHHLHISVVSQITYCKQQVLRRSPPQFVKMSLPSISI
jgi:hypothetical protein